jgi:hypothetical protein
MVLLRPTNRLQALLAEHGYTLNHFDENYYFDEDDYSNQHPVVEADYRITENTPADANAFHSLQRCLQQIHRGAALTIERESDLLVTAPTGRNGKLDCVDILWVSPTEFVSTKEFVQFRHHDSYQMTVELKRGGRLPLELRAYSIFRLNEDGEVIIGPPPVTPPLFLIHVLAPIFDQVSSIKLCSYHHATPPIDSALSLIPTTDHDLTQDIKICFSRPQSGLLPALVSFPFHPNVCLSLTMVPNDIAAVTQLHDCLRDMKHLRRLEIPPCLLDFECSGVAFTVNPAFQSLTMKTEDDDDFFVIPDDGPKRWSSTMLNGMVHKKNLKCLDIVFTGEGQGKRRETMRQLAKVLDSRSSHGHAISRLSVNEKVSSNILWDSLFSPALVVNWLKQQQQKATPPTVQLNHRLSEMAIRAINRGNAYRSATNLFHCDLTPSSASAIFHLVSTQHDESKNAGSPGAMSACGANQSHTKRQKYGHNM